MASKSSAQTDTDVQPKRGFNKRGEFIKPRPHIDHVVMLLKKKGHKKDRIETFIQTLRHKEEIIKECIALRGENRGKGDNDILPPNAAKGALEQLGIRSRTTLTSLIIRYQNYSEAYPDEPAINALIDIRGRPKQELLNPDQETVAIGAYLTRKRTSILSTGMTKQIFTRPEIDWVYSMLLLVWPDLALSIDQLRRFLKEKHQEDPILFNISRDDEDQTWMDRLPKRRNDVTRPKVRVQSDARALPILVKVGDIYCTVTLLTLIDDYTQFVLDYQLIPRKVEDENGIVCRVDYTAEDFRLLLANAMLEFEFRPLFVYTDRANQFKAIVPFLKLLSDDNLEPPTRWIPGRRRYAPGKGKIEKYQHLVDRLLRNLPAFIEEWMGKYPKRLSKDEIKEVMSLEELQQEFDTRTKNWNEGPRDNKPSRREDFISIPGPAIKPPSPFRVSLLGTIEKEYKPCRVYPRGILYDNIYYQPIYKNPEDYELLANKMDQDVPIGGVWMGKKGRVVFACLDGTNWIEVIPDTEQKTDDTSYHQMQRRLQQKKRSQRNMRRERFEQIILEQTGQYPGTDAQTGQARLVQPRPSRKPEQDSTGKDKQTPPKASSDSSTDTTGQKTPASSENVEQPKIPSNIPNFAARLRQMRGETDNKDQDS